MFMKRQKIQKLMKSPYNLDDLLWIGKYLDKWGECKITVERYQDPISERQRNYYFGVVVKICEEYYWYSREEMHEELKKLYLPDYVSISEEITKLGYDLKNLPQIFAFIAKTYDSLSITNETKGSFEAYLKRIRFGEGQNGILIPLPNEEQRWLGWEQMQ